MLYFCRMSLMLDAVKALPPVSTIIPTFDHMAVDTSWERKMLKKLTWLQEPGNVHYQYTVLSRCQRKCSHMELIGSSS